MDSINRQQTEENHKDLSGSEAGKKINMNIKKNIIKVVMLFFILYFILFKPVHINYILKKDLQFLYFKLNIHERLQVNFSCA